MKFLRGIVRGPRNHNFVIGTSVQAWRGAVVNLQMFARLRFDCGWDVLLSSWLPS